MKRRGNSISIALVCAVLLYVPTECSAEFQSRGPTDRESKSVAQWDRFEVAIDNKNSYRDPYTDVSLDAEFTRPDGSRVRFWGFYDGASTWRLRFTPDAVGTWRYHAEFSDGSGEASGSFECVASDLPGPVRAYAANPIWFGTADGSPVLLRSFHCGDRFFARNWDDAESDADGNPRTVFLDWAQAHRYNTLSIASHYLNRRSEGRGQGWETPQLWPLDAAEYGRLETMLDDLAQRRIIVFPFAGFLGRDADAPRTPTERTGYLRYTIARLGPYWNLLYNVAGPEPLLRGRPYMTYDEVNTIASEIARLDVFGHLLTIHNPTGDDVFRGEAWPGFGTLQGPKTTDRRKLAEGLLRNHHPARPLYAQETLWPGNQLGHPNYSDEDIRRNGYVILFSAAMINFGDMDGNSSSGFSNSMDPADAVPSRHAIIGQVWDAFAELPWQQTKPRPDLVDRGYCLADPGRTYLVYLEDRQPVNVKLEGGPFTVEWRAATDHRRRVRGEPTKNGRNLQPPGEGDWILILKSD